MKKRIFIFGGSGSGTTSIGKAVCDELGYKHFDSDNYLWLPTDEPYTVVRSAEEYIDLMGKDLTSNEKWILSGHWDLLLLFWQGICSVYVRLLYKVYNGEV